MRGTPSLHQLTPPHPPPIPRNPTSAGLVSCSFHSKRAGDAGVGTGSAVTASCVSGRVSEGSGGQDQQVPSATPQLAAKGTGLDISPGGAGTAQQSTMAQCHRAPWPRTLPKDEAKSPEPVLPAFPGALQPRACKYSLDASGSAQLNIRATAALSVSGS